MIYKSSSLIFFQIFDKLAQEIVLKTHDAYQIVGPVLSLGGALRSYCGAVGKE